MPSVRSKRGPVQCYKNTVDYNIFCGEWCIGRIYETRTGPESLRWFWALHAPGKPGEMRTSITSQRWTRPRPNSKRAWKQWKAWAGMEEVG
jgi:hypothetical protein